MEKAFDKDMRHADWDKVYARQLLRADLMPEWMDAIRLKAGERILEVGCGPGGLSLILAERVGPQGLVYALDSSADALAYLARKQRERGIAHIRTIVGDATTLELDVSADCAFVTMMLHHTDDPGALLRNVHRLLRPGAFMLAAEFHPDGPCEVGARRESRIAPGEVQAWCKDAGFVEAEYRRQTPEHYMVIAQRGA